MAGIDLPPSSSDDDKDSSEGGISQGQCDVASAQEVQPADAQEPADIADSNPKAGALKSGVGSAHASATAASKPLSPKAKTPPDLESQVDTLELQ